MMHPPARKNIVGKARTIFEDVLFSYIEKIYIIIYMI